MDSALHAGPPPRAIRKVAIPSPILGMLAFIVSESMFFAGLISAFTISRAGTIPAMWPPPGQPRLPASSTALNTAALVVSGVMLTVAYLQFRRAQALPGKKSGAAGTLLGLSWLFGAGFVVMQGVEWVALLSQGLTLTSSTLGSFFYLIVGAHGLHAVVALFFLGMSFLKYLRGTLSPMYLLTVQTFWWFVVGLWPVIYLRVYF